MQEGFLLNLVKSYRSIYCTLVLHVGLGILLVLLTYGTSYPCVLVFSVREGVLGGLSCLMKSEWQGWI